MKTISFATMKGGTGKTTTCFHIACGLARLYKVLIIDFDPQCNISSNLRFPIFEMSEDSYTVADIFENFETDPLDILIQHPIEELPNLDFFPSNLFINGTEQMVYTRSCREQIITNYINNNRQFFEYYDYVIFDTGPNMGIINQNAFFASDQIILVLDPSVHSAGGAQVFMYLWQKATEYSNKKSNNVNALIINNLERINVAKEMEEFLESNEFFSKIKLESKIIHTTRFKECDVQNKPIYFLETKTKDQATSKMKAIECIDAVINELFERGVF